MSDSFVTLWTIAWQAALSMGFSSNKNGVSCHVPLQEIFPTQVLNLYHFCLLHYGLVLIISFYSPLFSNKKSMLLKTNKHTVLLYYQDCLLLLIPLGFSLLLLLMSSLLYLSSKLLVLHHSFSIFISCFILYIYIYIYIYIYTVHGVLRARILNWFAIPFTSGLCFARTHHHDPSVLGSPTRCGP